MNETALLQHYLLTGAILFGIGLIGFVVRRNIIIMFLCAEMMLQGVSMSLVAWSRYHGNWDGQSLVLMIIAVAACEPLGEVHSRVWNRLPRHSGPAQARRPI